MPFWPLSDQPWITEEVTLKIIGSDRLGEMFNAVRGRMTAARLHKPSWMSNFSQFYCRPFAWRLALASFPFRRRRVYRKFQVAAELLAAFTWEVILANLRVARDVVRPLRELRPAVVAVSLNLDSAAQITMLANLITLTPGTLSLDVSPDRKVLYIHAMNGRDLEKLRREIGGLERQIKELLS
jgi:multicomponent Na+:H+ antiporter subunit E